LNFLCNGSFGRIQLKASVGEEELISYAVCRQKPTCILRVEEEGSLLDAHVGETVQLTVLAVDCRYENLSYSGEPGWLMRVSASRMNVSEKTEKIRVSYLCKRASDYPLYISVKAGDGEALGYAHCRP